jgi:dihydropteroate synthase
MYTLNCKGKLLVIEKPLVMGIINITDNSFYQGFLLQDVAQIVALAGNMLQAGASIIDIGGQSTKPGSTRLSADEEIKRIVPIIVAIISKHPTAIISIDTYYSQVAMAAVTAGASIVNDVSAGDMDAAMLQTVANLQVPFICMHMQGTPATMQQQPTYDDVTQTILDYFIAKIAACTITGIHDVIIDPGFGFGKTMAHNFTLLKQLNVLKILQKPILVGISRKSMVYNTLGNTAQQALNGTTVLHTVALLQGANIIRVHDVQEAVEVVQLLQAYNSAI